MSKPPVRQEAIQAGVEKTIMPEVEAQTEARAKREAEERRRQRPKATYDLPLWLTEAVTAIASTESVARSDIAELALREFVHRYKAGGVNLEPYKQPAKSLRVIYKLALPDEL